MAYWTITPPINRLTSGMAPSLNSPSSFFDISQEPVLPFAKPTPLPGHQGIYDGSVFHEVNWKNKSPAFCIYLNTSTTGGTYKYSYFEYSNSNVDYVAIEEDISNDFRIIVGWSDLIEQFGTRKIDATESRKQEWVEATKFEKYEYTYGTSTQTEYTDEYNVIKTPVESFTIGLWHPIYVYGVAGYPFEWAGMTWTSFREYGTVTKTPPYPDYSMLEISGDGFAYAAPDLLEYIIGNNDVPIINGWSQKVEYERHDTIGNSIDITYTRTSYHVIISNAYVVTRTHYERYWQYCTLYGVQPDENPVTIASLGPNPGPNYRNSELGTNFLYELDGTQRWAQWESQDIQHAGYAYGDLRIEKNIVESVAFFPGGAHTIYYPTENISKNYDPVTAYILYDSKIYTGGSSTLGYAPTKEICENIAFYVDGVKYDIGLDPSLRIYNSNIHIYEMGTYIFVGFLQSNNNDWKIEHAGAAILTKSSNGWSVVKRTIPYDSNTWTALFSLPKIGFVGEQWDVELVLLEKY